MLKAPGEAPTYKTPLTTAGEDSPDATPAPGHRSAPVLASKAYKAPLFPKYTTPLATAGEDKTGLNVVYCQRSAHVLAFKANTLGPPLFSSVPKYTTPLTTVGEDSIFLSPVAYCHFGARLPTVAGLRTNSYGL